MRKPLLLTIVTMLLATVLSGCGQKGPLVLPEPETAPAQERR